MAALFVWNPKAHYERSGRETQPVIIQYNCNPRRIQ